LAALAVVVAIIAAPLLQSSGGWSAGGGRPVCAYGGSHPPRTPAEEWALGASFAPSAIVGSSLIPTRLRVSATRARFDEFVADFQRTACGGKAALTRISGADMSSVESLLGLLRGVAAAAVDSGVAFGIIAVDDIELAPRGMREALKGLLDTGRLVDIPFTPTNSKQAEWLRFAFLLRLEPGVDELTLYNARVGYLMTFLQLP
jgi:hypothetical protein